MKSQSKKRRMVIIIALSVLILGIAGAVLAKNMTTELNPTPAVTPEKSTDVGNGDSSTEAETTEDTPYPETSTPVPSVDPSTLSSVDIAPLGIKVFYTKGVAGFDFAVKRTADSTEYVEFSTADLIGTKCTDDEGSFASIIKNPTQSTQQATSETITVGNDTYGLSLAGNSCTADVELLGQYQAAFTNGFTSLSTL